LLRLPPIPHGLFLNPDGTKLSLSVVAQGLVVVIPSVALAIHPVKVVEHPAAEFLRSSLPQAQ